MGTIAPSALRHPILRLRTCISVIKRHFSILNKSCVYAYIHQLLCEAATVSAFGRKQKVSRHKVDGANRNRKCLGEKPPSLEGTGRTSGRHEPEFAGTGRGKFGSGHGAAVRRVDTLKGRRGTAVCPSEHMYCW